MAKGFLGKLTLELREKAREFRRNPTEAEAILWDSLRARRLDGFKFKRQVAIDQFVLDFCCLNQKLIVEVDGEVHAGQRQRDRVRTEKLVDLGFRVIRFTNQEVANDLESVKKKILAALNPSPLPLSR